MDNEETYDHYNIEVGNDTVQTLVTNSPGMVDSWIAKIERIHRRRLNRLVIGLDIEWRPNFRRGQSNPVALLQLCVGRRCLIFQILHAPNFPDSLTQFLGDGNYTFVGAGVYKDAERLASELDVDVTTCVELGDLAVEASGGDRRMKNAGLKGLAREFLEMDLEKPREVQLSKWDARWLTLDQVQYACTDAFVSFEIGRVLEAWK
ncbi:3'-5' exonuclease-like [Humulus lupulus]|uniref:3'-5' exonuclease-like n=1 Tax=Humulus lupulus TaxID=3486 RepID=UPI002B40AEBF|nr:3'-5' exonuclease-like [Humulus lupulus]